MKSYHDWLQFFLITLCPREEKHLDVAGLESVCSTTSRHYPPRPHGRANMLTS